MSNRSTTLVGGTLLAVGLAFATVVYAAQSPMPGMNGTPMSADHMGSNMSQGRMMGMQGGMMGNMGQMMDGCLAMMQSPNQPPNSQFHKPTPPSQEE